MSPRRVKRFHHKTFEEFWIKVEKNNPKKVDKFVMMHFDELKDFCRNIFQESRRRVIHIGGKKGQYFDDGFSRNEPLLLQTMSGTFPKMKKGEPSSGESGGGGSIPNQAIKYT